MAQERHQTRIEIEGDHEVEVNVNQADGRWFRMFHAVIESGAWSRLTPNTGKVYAILAKHSDDQWVSWPSIPRIMALAGVSRRAVFRAITELQKNGLLVLQRKRGGRAMANVYQLVEPPILVRNGAKTAPVSAPKRCQNRHENGAKTAPPIRLKEKDSSSAKNGATAPGPAAAVIDALVRAGIGEPTRSELANLPHVTSRMVERIAEQAGGRGKGPGAMVLDIRAASEKAQRDAERKRQRREAERKVQQEIAEQREQEASDMVTGDERRELLDAGWEALGRRQI